MSLGYFGEVEGFGDGVGLVRGVAVVLAHEVEDFLLALGLVLLELLDQVALFLHEVDAADDLVCDRLGLCLDLLVDSRFEGAVLQLFEGCLASLHLVLDLLASQVLLDLRVVVLLRVVRLDVQEPARLARLGHEAALSHLLFFEELLTSEYLELLEATLLALFPVEQLVRVAVLGERLGLFVQLWLEAVLGLFFFEQLLQQHLVLLSVDDGQFAHLLVQVARAVRFGELPGDQVDLWLEGVLQLLFFEEEFFAVLLVAFVEVVLAVEEAVFEFVEGFAVLEDLWSASRTSSLM